MPKQPLQQSTIYIKPREKLTDILADLQRTREGRPTYLNKQQLSVKDIQDLMLDIRAYNQTTEYKIYLHELLEGAEIILPENAETPRNENLEKRCELLKNQIDNELYVSMTKNVDCNRVKHPEDTMASQLKEMDKQLVAVVQFLVSVLTGFAFGFIGIGLLFSMELNIGLRIIIGLICAFIIAVAEFYFLMKKLNDDIPKPDKTQSISISDAKVKTD